MQGWAQAFQNARFYHNEAIIVFEFSFRSHHCCVQILGSLTSLESYGGIWNTWMPSLHLYTLHMADWQWMKPWSNPWVSLASSNMPEKQIKQGEQIETWAESNKGFIQKFQIHCGKAENQEKGLACRVVMDLTKHLIRTHCSIHFNNFYTRLPALNCCWISS